MKENMFMKIMSIVVKAIFVMGIISAIYFMVR